MSNEMQKHYEAQALAEHDALVAANRQATIESTGFLDKIFIPILILGLVFVLVGDLHQMIQAFFKGFGLSNEMALGATIGSYVFTLLTIHLIFRFLSSVIGQKAVALVRRVIKAGVLAFAAYYVSTLVITTINPVYIYGFSAIVGLIGFSAKVGYRLMMLLLVAMFVDGLLSTGYVDSIVRMLPRMTL